MHASASVYSSLGNEIKIQCSQLAAIRTEPSSSRPKTQHSAFLTSLTPAAPITLVNIVNLPRHMTAAHHPVTGKMPPTMTPTAAINIYDSIFV